MFLAQVIGGLAFFIGIAAFLQKKDIRFRYLMTAFCLIMSVHFLLMGALTAAIGVTINAARIYISIKTQSKKVMWAFIFLLTLFMLPSIENIYQFLPYLGSAICTWALFSTTGIKLRLFILFNSSCWFIHNLSISSIGGSLIEGLFVLTNLYTIVLLYRQHEAMHKGR
ncbi:YgjV family protein [Vibrio sp. SS-MA-C1-2]|uniref:YgjV family protein n=1 Tax=Vibrio sp. SS-MA-C1-2 TaxID=2908646 RepID=UPI001F2FCAA2|nr:YgjV family protein [Vibrio sp. SS-MA-C1-2]UJF18267.1 YgjV family protein [Vibrio sp. SS-MA-C1-2]